jgi:hypothetical protein
MNDPAANRTMARELVRILWRQRLLSTPGGLAWLIAHARERERDLGPHRTEAP